MIVPHPANSLPALLWKDLQQLAEMYETQGAILFIFGSFARGNQLANSDLDLGVEWPGEPNQAVFRTLQKKVANLPTIRKIDLVDFHEVDETFKKVATLDKIYLTPTAMSEAKKQQLIKNFQDIMARWHEALQMSPSGIVRDSTILRFELTYEVSWKLVQLLGREQGYVVNSPRQSFELAFTMGWVTDEEVWADILIARNTAIHVYRETYAQALYDKLPRFYRAFAELLAALQPIQ